MVEAVPDGGSQALGLQGDTGVFLVDSNGIVTIFITRFMYSYIQYYKAEIKKH